MKKFGIALVIVIVGALAWYLGSPLFIDEVVEEDFPVVQQPEPAQPRQPEQEEKTVDEMIEEMEELTQEEVDAMEPSERDIMQKKMDAVAKQMPDKVMEDDMPTEPVALKSGQFVDADAFHKGSGTATLYKLADESHPLRFSDFSVTNGPALSVFLTKADGTMTEVAKLKGNKGSQNYTIAPEINVDEYTGVLIYCAPFKVPFATADLQ